MTTRSNENDDCNLTGGATDQDDQNNRNANKSGNTTSAICNDGAEISSSCSSLVSEPKTSSSSITKDLPMQTPQALPHHNHHDHHDLHSTTDSSNISNTSHNNMFNNFHRTRIHDKKAYCNAMEEAVRLLQREKVLLQKTTYFSVEAAGTELAAPTFNNHDHHRSKASFPKKKHHETKKKADKRVLKKLKKTVAGLCQERDQLWNDYEQTNINTATATYAKKLPVK